MILREFSFKALGLQGTIVAGLLCLLVFTAALLFCRPASAQMDIPDFSGQFIEEPRLDAFSYDLDKVLAKGEGFKISGRQVKEVRDHFVENTPLRTTDDQYLKTAVMLELFLREGIREGLFDPDVLDLAVKERLNFRDLFILNFLDQHELDDNVIKSYYHAFPERYLLEEQVPGENNNDPADAGESSGSEEGNGDVYKDSEAGEETGSEEAEEDAPQAAGPDSDLEDPDYNKGLIKRNFIPADRIRPLDEELRRDIRARILTVISSSLINSEYERLVDEYNVVFHN